MHILLKRSSKKKSLKYNNHAQETLTGAGKMQVWNRDAGKETKGRK
jgi:hypothetical protein